MYACKREKGRREKGKSAEKSWGKYREGGSPLTKDGVKMEGEKCGKGEPHVTRLSFFLFLFLSPIRFLLGVPMGIRLPKRAGRFRNFAGGIPRAMRQLFKTISISVPKRDIRCLMLLIYKWKYLKSVVQSKKEIDQSLTARFYRCCESFSQRVT